MKLTLRKRIKEVSYICGISEDIIIHFIHEEWIYPNDEQLLVLDEEDIARINLINELKKDFGVNDEAIPIILHLIDQLNVLRKKLNEMTHP